MLKSSVVLNDFHHTSRELQRLGLGLGLKGLVHNLHIPEQLFQGDGLVVADWQIVTEHFCYILWYTVGNIAQDTKLCVIVTLTYILFQFDFRLFGNVR